MKRTTKPAPAPATPDAPPKWAVSEVIPEDHGRAHVYPLFGLEHYMNPHCWRSPKPHPTERGLLIHEASQ